MIKSCSVLRYCIRPASSRFYATGLTDISKLHSQILTVEDVREKLRENVQYRQRFRYPPTPWPANHPQEVKAIQCDLPTRRPLDSFVSCFVPMDDPRERMRYLDHGGGLRLGRFLEDLDILAGVICYKHDLNPALEGVDNGKSPYAFMTVLVDSIELMKNQPALTDDKDVYLNGKVTWVGTSSVECTMNIEQEVDGTIEKIMVAKYIMVARNPATNSAGVVNPLLLETMQDLHTYNLAEDNRLRRQEQEKRSLLKTPPTQEEKEHLHDMFLATKELTALSAKRSHLPGHCVWMKDTALRSVITCYPEDGSVYNKIFGGFTMRKAHELATATASAFSHSHVTLCRSIDDVHFLKSVDIGDQLRLQSMVVHTSGSEVQVYVRAEKFNTEKKTGEMTNDFHFTFDTGVDNLRTVIPKTYSEALMYLCARRYKSVQTPTDAAEQRTRIPHNDQIMRYQFLLKAYGTVLRHQTKAAHLPIGQ
ncbi:hypothetical protein EGW08_001002 [Elysia chlorotica]|uniref:HotDog ACOT-type domain-containing protein n=1 Tax=Elysia chlorotica TaxID=188477 RepID=A0A433UBM5_ELYCH|nr:hypothetical protein EGW08_001002 [Elysia chlorotica]